jgi:pilus assembly protein CpaD
MSNARRLVSLTLGLATLALTAACNSPSQEPPAMDYRQKYALPVQAQTATLLLHFNDARTGVSAEEDAALMRLAGAYLDRGHGPITISAAVPAARGPVDMSGIEAVRQRLLAAGVPAGAIRVALSYDGTPSTVTLSYEHYEVALPICGDWTSNPTYDYYNDVPANFGCALQRDIGLMVADPADLVHRRAAAPTDAQNSDRVMQKFRTGQSPAATQSPLQQRGAAGITSTVGQ